VPATQINGVRLHYEIKGSGPPLVMVHGGWTDHHSWQAVVPGLAERFRVITYDRRGHSLSERPAGGQTRRQSETDLAELIRALHAEPAYVVGNSYGGLVSMGVAARWPSLVRALAIHEPPAVAVAGHGERARPVAAAAEGIRQVVAEIEEGAFERGTRRFMEEVALGPGAWEMLPEATRATFVGNAPAFAAEQSDPDWAAVDVERVRMLGSRLQVSQGDASLLWFQAVADRLGELFPAAARATIAGAGHAPNLTHPDEYAELLAAFFLEERAVAA